MRSTLAFLLALPLLAPAAAAAEPRDDAAAWTVYVANDNCPDYTWGLTEEQTRQAFADIVRGHLDEMNRTDKEPSENQDRYNMAVTQEALCFVEKYPDRKDELIRRIKEGRVFVSPYLCNSLWGMASVEQTIRTLYPAGGWNASGASRKSNGPSTSRNPASRGARPRFSQGAAYGGSRTRSTTTIPPSRG